MTTAMWAIMAVGSIPGFLVGRWSAEFRRARVDQKRVWATRQNYRRN